MASLSLRPRQLKQQQLPSTVIHGGARGNFWSTQRTWARTPWGTLLPFGNGPASGRSGAAATAGALVSSANSNLGWLMRSLLAPSQIVQPSFSVLVGTRDGRGLSKASCSTAVGPLGFITVHFRRRVGMGTRIHWHEHQGPRSSRRRRRAQLCILPGFARSW